MICHFWIHDVLADIKQYTELHALKELEMALDSALLSCPRDATYRQDPEFECDPVQGASHYFR